MKVPVEVGGAVVSAPSGRATYQIVFLGDGGELLLGAFDTPATGADADKSAGTDPDALERLRRRLESGLFRRDSRD